MSIKAIMVTLGGSDRETPALEIALQAARAFDGHIEVLHVRADSREIFPFMAEPVSAGSIELIVEAAEKGAAELAAKARGQFDAFCQANGVSVARTAPAGGGVFAIWHEETGLHAEIVAARGRLADLIVVSRPVEETPAPVMLETALLETGRPVLVAPPQAPAALGRNVAIAWNGSAEASRAVAAALPFLTGAEKVTVLTAAEKGEFVASGADLSAYLAWHGVRASTGTVDPGDGAAGEALLGEAEKIGADLLVMGGYGHSRVREIILGGVTYHVLSNADIPVLMAH